MATLVKHWLQKKISLASALLCLASISAAQDTTSKTIFTERSLQIGLGIGTVRNGDVYFSYCPSQKWFYSLDENFFRRLPAYTPDDYYGPLICLSGNCMAKEAFSYTTIFTGYYFVNTNKIRFGAAAGPSLVNYKEVIFTRHEEQGMGFFNPGYAVSYRNHISGGVGLKTGLELRFGKFISMEPAFYSNINTRHAIYSGDLCISVDFPLRAK